MALDAEQFAQVLAVLDTSSHGSKHELRRAPRMVQRCKLTIKTVAEDQPMRQIDVTMRDLSSRGIGLIINEGMDLGKQFMVSLARKKAPPITILCTVAFCQKLPDGTFAVGAEFTCVTDTHKTTGGTTEEERIRESMFN